MSRTPLTTTQSHRSATASTTWEGEAPAEPNTSHDPQSHGSATASTTSEGEAPAEPNTSQAPQSHGSATASTTWEGEAPAEPNTSHDHWFPRVGERLNILKYGSSARQEPRPPELRSRGSAIAHCPLPTAH